MTSAPRSARSWVPKGPAPNCETERMRSPASMGAVGAGARPARAAGGLFEEDVAACGLPALAMFTQRGVVLLGEQGGAREGHHALAALVRHARLHRDRAAVTLLGVARGQHGGLGVDGVADERG